jgi:hypothetical protein
MTLNIVKLKYPIEYELSPAVIEKGTNWITLKLKNVGSGTLTNLDVKLHSLDSYNLSIYGAWWFGAGQHIKELETKKYIELVYQINAIGSADVYVTIKGLKDGNYFWWESGFTNIKLSDEKAEIVGLLVLSNPYTTIGKTVSAEATIKGLRKTDELTLELWVETPSGIFEEQATMEIKNLPLGEESRYTAEFTPKESGFYTIYAYLFDEWMRIGYKIETIFVQNQ